MTRFQDKPRIVLCEADEGLREAFGLMLEGWATSTVFSKANDCFTHLTQQQADLLVLDLDGQNTEPLALVLSLRIAHPDLKTLLVAGEFDYDFQVNCVKLGGFSFLTKLFSAPAAVAKMKTLLGLEAPSIHTRIVKIALS